jgi:hypothetical protein
VLCSDTHFGGVASQGNAAGNIPTWVESTVDLNPDHLLHLGDVTDWGADSQFTEARQVFDDLVARTNIDRVWAIAGGSHDGLCALGSPIMWRLGFHRILRNTSQWYTLKIGNNVFVMLGYFAQPGGWSSGEYGGTDRADIMNQNKVDWLERTLNKWDGQGNNIFICRHFPLHHTHIRTHSWPNMDRDRFIYECGLIRDLLGQTQDVVAWFGAHVHIDSDARVDGWPGTSNGTILDGATRPELPGQMHFVSIGDIWRQHSGGWFKGFSTFSNFRYMDLEEGRPVLTLRAWDSTHQRQAPMSVSSPGGLAWEYFLPLRYPPAGIDAAVEYEQAWDVWEYCEEDSYPWYQDNEGLRRDRDGWIESRWDFWESKSFATAQMIVDSSAPTALQHRIQYSNDGMQTWSEESYTPETLQQMPAARWIRVLTDISTTVPVFIRDIRFEF